LRRKALINASDDDDIDIAFIARIWLYAGMAAVGTLQKRRDDNLLESCIRFEQLA